MLPGFNDEGRTVLGTINGIAYICCSLPMACNLLLEVLDLGMLVMVDTTYITKKQNVIAHSIFFMPFSDPFMGGIAVRYSMHAMLLSKFFPVPPFYQFLVYAVFLN
jgi:hypothetical protein